MRNLLICLVLIASTCTSNKSAPSGGTGDVPTGDSAQVMRVIDGDTIDVEIGGVGYRVRDPGAGPAA